MAVVMGETQQSRDEQATFTQARRQVLQMTGAGTAGLWLAQGLMACGDDDADAVSDDTGGGDVGYLLS